jgi:diguanylate cyclase (GGDEF)-like protein
MHERELYKEALKKLEKRIDAVIIISVIPVILSAILLVLRNDSNKLFVYFDFFIVAIFIIMHLFKTRINFEHKIYLVMAILLSFSILSLYYGSFVGSGIITLAILNVLSIAFLDTKKAIIVGFGSGLIIVIFGLSIEFGFVSFTLDELSNLGKPFYWYLQSVTFSLFVVTNIVIGLSIRRLLINNIIRLRSKLDTIEKNKETINNLSLYDNLTGLPNRNLFINEIEGILKTSKKQSTLILIDIKDFKSINSHLGPENGDLILKTVGELLNKNVNFGVKASRLGGNEFALWTDGDRDEVIKQLAQFKDSVKLKLQEISLYAMVDFYISFVKHPDDGNNFEEIYKRATLALRYAKEHNSNTPERFSKDMLKEFEFEVKVKEQIENAMTNNEFTVVYQAKVNSNDSKLKGVEALLRWNSKLLGKVSPGVFVPIITKTNWIDSFNIHVFKLILDDFSSMSEQLNSDISLSINISPLFFLKENFVDLVIKEIENKRISYDRIILEITEDVLISDVDIVSEKIKELRNYGIRFSLDDFGTGYSSLKYLTSIHFDEIKIDKAFIDNVVLDEKAKDLLSSIVAIGNVMNYEVVAEGVETKAQLEEVNRAGCNVIQGYYYSIPGPKDEILIRAIKNF